MAQQKPTLRKRLKAGLKRLGAWGIAVTYHIHIWCVWRTARIEVAGCDRLIEAMRRHDRLALAMWHENLIIAAYALRECRPTTVASKSDIGDVISTILDRLDYRVFRGGSSRGKSRRSPVLEEMVAYFKSHRDVMMALTVDGSAGPARKMKPGVIALAGQAQAPIFVMHCVCRPCFRIWTWDRTRVPLGFGKIVIVFEGPVMPGDPGIKGFRVARDKTDLLLHDAARRAEAYLKTKQLPATDPELGLDPGYGSDDMRRGRTLCDEKTPLFTPTPIGEQLTPERDEAARTEQAEDA
ncbi:DUF374 domain-containing protein [Phycisphaeraceae bacterium D3-23]